MSFAASSRWGPARFLSAKADLSHFETYATVFGRLIGLSLARRPGRRRRRLTWRLGRRRRRLRRRLGRGGRRLRRGGAGRRGPGRRRRLDLDYHSDLRRRLSRRRRLVKGRGNRTRLLHTNRLGLFGRTTLLDPPEQLFLPGECDRGVPVRGRVQPGKLLGGGVDALL